MQDSAPNRYKIMQFKTDQWNLALHSNLPLISFFMHLTILSSFSTTPAWMIAFLCIEIYDGQWSHHSTKSFLQRGIQRTNGFLSSILNNPIVLSCFLWVDYCSKTSIQFQWKNVLGYTDETGPISTILLHWMYY